VIESSGNIRRNFEKPSLQSPTARSTVLLSPEGKVLIVRSGHLTVAEFAGTTDGFHPFIQGQDTVVLAQGYRLERRGGLTLSEVTALDQEGALLSAEASKLNRKAIALNGMFGVVRDSHPESVLRGRRFRVRMACFIAGQGLTVVCNYARLDTGEFNFAGGKLWRSFFPVGHYAFDGPGGGQ
jgi:hypothetical protein